MVVLPAPFGPRNPVTVPGRTVKLRSSTAVTGPKRLVSRSTSITIGSAGRRRGARGAPVPPPGAPGGAGSGGAGAAGPVPSLPKIR